MMFPLHSLFGFCVRTRYALMPTKETQAENPGSAGSLKRTPCIGMAEDRPSGSFDSAPIRIVQHKFRGAPLRMTQGKIPRERKIFLDNARTIMDTTQECYTIP